MMTSKPRALSSIPHIVDDYFVDVSFLDGKGWVCYFIPVLLSDRR